jgi:ABC-type transport system involved in multi-copper enzyme maturation permease subunit
MTLPAAFFAIRWLVRDTFRQARASGIAWLMLSVTALAVIFCLGVSTVDLPKRPTGSDRPERIPRSVYDTLPAEQRDGTVDVIEGKLYLAFGAVPVPWNTYRDDAVRYLEFVLLGLIADSGGILLALIWTAGFLPTFLEAGNASVLLAKPVPRWSLLVGKYLGVLVFVAFQAVLFVGGVWCALGIKTGVWHGTAWLALPVLLLHFGVFFSFSALLAVMTRSTVACVFGSLLFWLVCVAMNLGRHDVLTQPDLKDLPSSFRLLVDAGYWTLPKPADMGVFLLDSLQAEKDFPESFSYAGLRKVGGWHPELSLFSSLLFGLVMLVLSAFEFSKADY